MTDMREAETEQQQRARHQRTYQARKKEDGKCARCTQPALPGPAPLRPSRRPRA